MAEVAARFTLDAMPGKQMAIDADLSSGLINEQEARMRRYKIQKEADFYGAMDGATKIVKGDAVMSLIITVINFVAGLIIGMMSGIGTDAAVQIYSIATIGDGLVSQLPALMISTATGHDRHPLRLRRQPQQRRAGPVPRPAPGHYGHRRGAALPGGYAQHAPYPPLPRLGRPAGAGLVDQRPHGAGEAGPGPGGRPGGAGAAPGGAQRGRLLQGHQQRLLPAGGGAHRDGVRLQPDPPGGRGPGGPG